MPLFGVDKGMKPTLLNKAQRQSVKKLIKRTYGDPTGGKIVGAWLLSDDHPDRQFGRLIVDVDYLNTRENSVWSSTVGTAASGRRPHDWTVWAD